MSLSESKSELLKQAVIDAAELQKAALRSAEKMVLEKNAVEIKKAVEQMLNEADGEDDVEVADEEGSEEEDLTVEAPSDKIPAAATTGEDACPCPDDDEEVEIDFGELQRLSDELQAEPAEAEPHVELASVGEATEPGVTEDLEITLEDFMKLQEELVVDLKPVKSGWAGIPDSAMDYNEELELARRASTKAREEQEILKASLKDLKLENKNLRENLQKAIGLLKEVNLSNTKLFYTNKALKSNSLNERQKTTIVDAISKATTIEQAKLVFESLKDGMPSSDETKEADTTLTEAIKSKSRPLLQLGNKQANQTSPDLFKERMQVLAGITSSKGGTI